MFGRCVVVKDIIWGSARVAMSEGSGLTLLVGGPAGSGVFATGTIAAKALVYHGYSVFATNEYPSLIRGGHQWFLVVARWNGEALAHRRQLDVVLALDNRTVELHAHKLRKGGFVVCDEKVAGSLPNAEGVVSLPLSQLVSEVGAPPVAVNVAGLAALFGMLGGSLEQLHAAIRSYYRGRERLAELNVKVAAAGYTVGAEHSDRAAPKLKYEPRGRRLLIDGNSAVALGLLAGGMSFFAAYPITPASPILHFLAEVQRETGVAVVQAECELAAINMAIGAAFAGARSAVATSGPGFSLMTESLGEAAMTETPIVVVNVQRAGPSTGLPTHTAQGDLRFAIHASHGEFPRVVLAPGDPVEAYELACEALNIAWRYQVPVILLSDKFLGESYWTIEKLPEVQPEEGAVLRGSGTPGYVRYKITDSGVSPMALPGTEGVRVYANSNEHDEQGIVTTDPAVVKAMQDKRWRKLLALREEAERRGVKVYGEGGVALLVWGSVKTIAMEALRDLGGVKLVQVVWLEPFPAKALREAVGSRRLLVAENNARGQLASLVREHVLREPDAILLKYDGQPLEPEEVIEFVRANAR
jgi:2-oxoglutarate ferredoxin oxidoreductase subunit alpha